MSEHTLIWVLIGSALLVSYLIGRLSQQIISGKEIARLHEQLFVAAERCEKSPRRGRGRPRKNIAI